MKTLKPTGKACRISSGPPVLDLVLREGPHLHGEQVLKTVGSGLLLAMEKPNGPRKRKTKGSVLGVLIEKFYKPFRGLGPHVVILRATRQEGDRLALVQQMIINMTCSQRADANMKKGRGNRYEKVQLNKIIGEGPHELTYLLSARKSSRLDAIRRKWGGSIQAWS